MPRNPRLRGDPRPGPMVFWGGVAVLIASAVYLGLRLAESPPVPVWIRVWGGSVAGDTPLVLRLERGSSVASREPAEEVVCTVQLSDETGQLGTAQVTLDEDDSGIVTFARSGTKTLRLRVTAKSQTLAEGTIAFSAQALGKLLTVHSGVVHGQRRGPFQIEVALSEGRLVLGRKGNLQIQIFDANQRPQSSPVTVEAQGMTLVTPSLTQGHHSDANGLLRLTVLPTDLSASLRLRVAPASASPGEFMAEVPVEKAQYWGTLSAGKLELQSLLPLSFLHYALVNEQGIWARGRAALTDAGESGKVARIEDIKGVTGPRWLVVGREPALDGPASIGWPLDVSVATPKTTVSMHEQLLLDGKVRALREYESAMAARANGILSGFVAVSVLFLLTVAGYLWQLSRPVPSVEVEDGLRVEVPVQSGVVGWVLFLCLAVALTALGVWVAMRAFAG